MSEVIYNEDLVKTVKNKYLAVNVIAKRARDINAEGLPLAPVSAKDNKKKPVAVATQELIEEKLHFEKSETRIPASNTPSIFTDTEEAENEDNLFDEELLEHGPEVDSDEPEEGL